MNAGADARRLKVLLQLIALRGEYRKNMMDRLAIRQSLPASERQLSELAPVSFSMTSPSVGPLVEIF